MTRFTDMWCSLRSMPLWVQIWMAFILVPINFAGLLFLDTRTGQIAAVLGILGILPNAIVLWLQRGFSNMMALPHLVPWTVLVVFIVWVLATGQASGALQVFLIILLVIDVISLSFDYADALKWLRGDRAVNRPN